MTAIPATLPIASVSTSPSGPLQWLLVVVLAIACLGLAWFTYERTQPAVHGARRGLLTFLRGTVFLLMLLMLLEPIVHREERVQRPPGVLLLIDSSGSMGIENSDGTARATSASQLRELVRGELAGRGESVRVFEGEGSRRVVSSREVGDEGASGLGMRGEGTDLAGLLVSAAQRHLEDNLAAIVLFSDGVSTVTEQPSLAGMRVPVFTVAVGDTSGPADLRLDRVRYPPLAYRGEDVAIEAELVVDDAGAGETWALLESENAPPESLRVRWPDGGGRVPLRFVVEADSLGLSTHDLRIVPLPDEPLQQNNSIEIGFEVRKDRLRLLYVESRPTWNFHFIARRAAADPRFEFTGVHRAADGWRIAGADSSWSIPLTIEETEGIDAWICGSLDDLAELSERGGALRESVEAGAGLLVLFGEPARRSLRPLSPGTRRLLPVQLETAARWVQESHRVRPTAYGLGHPVLAFGPTVGDVSMRLAEMPPLWEAVHALRLADGADEILRVQSGEDSAPLLAVHQLGRGHVASWSGAPMWSWSFWRLGETEGQDVYDALVGNLLYYLAEGGDRSRLRLLLPRSVLAQGEDVSLRAVALDQRLQPDESRDVWLEWLAGREEDPDPESEPTGRARMDLDRTTAGGRRLPLPALPAGRYHFRLAVEEGNQRILSPWRQMIIDPYSVEFQRPGVDRGALARIAEQTGGHPMSADGLQDWAASIPLRERTVILTGRVELWSSLWLFVPLLLALSLEWALRKRWGLV